MNEYCNNLYRILVSAKKDGLTDTKGLENSSYYNSLFTKPYLLSNEIIKYYYKSYEINAMYYVPFDVEDAIVDFTFHLIETVRLVIARISVSYTSEEYTNASFLTVKKIYNSSNLLGYYRVCARNFILSKVCRKKHLMVQPLEYQESNEINNDSSYKTVWSESNQNVSSIPIQSDYLIQEVFEKLSKNKNSELAVLTLALDFANIRKEYTQEIEYVTNPQSIIQLTNKYINLALSQHFTNLSKYYVYSIDFVNIIAGKSKKEISTIMSNVKKSHNARILSSYV